MTRPTMEHIRTQAKEFLQEYLACDLRNDEARYPLDPKADWMLHLVPDFTQPNGVTVRLLAIINKKEVHIGDFTDL